MQPPYQRESGASPDAYRAAPSRIPDAYRWIEIDGNDVPLKPPYRPRKRKRKAKR